MSNLTEFISKQPTASGLMSKGQFKRKACIQTRSWLRSRVVDLFWNHTIKNDSFRLEFVSCDPTKSVEVVIEYFYAFHQSFIFHLFVSLNVVQ